MHTVGAAVGAAAEHGARVGAEVEAGAGVEVGAGAGAGAGARAGAGASVAPTAVLPMVHRPGAWSDPSLVEGSADPARPMAIVTGDDRAGRVVHGTRGEAALVPAAVGAAAGDSSAAGAGAGARIGRVDAQIPQTGIVVPARSDGAADRGKEVQRPRIPTSLLTVAASQSSILVRLRRSIRRAQLRQSTVATTRWSLHTAGLLVLCIALQRFPAHLHTLRLHRRPCKLQLRLRQRI